MIMHDHPQGRLICLAGVLYMISKNNLNKYLRRLSNICRTSEGSGAYSDKFDEEELVVGGAWGVGRALARVCA